MTAKTAILRTNPQHRFLNSLRQKPNAHNFKNTFTCLTLLVSQAMGLDNLLEQYKRKWRGLVPHLINKASSKCFPYHHYCYQVPQFNDKTSACCWSTVNEGRAQHSRYLRITIALTNRILLVLTTRLLISLTLPISLPNSKEPLAQLMLK